MNQLITCVVQCVPERANIVNNIIDRLIKRMEVLPFFDYEHKGVRWNFNRILNYQYQTEYILYLQDDVIFCNHFEENILDIIKYDFDAVSLFVPPRKKYLQMMDKGVRFYEEKDFLWMPGMLFKKGFLSDLSKYSEKNNTMHDDVLVGDFCKETKRYVKIAIPSLVQHNLSIKSTLGTATKVGKTLRQSPLFNPEINLRW